MKEFDVSSLAHVLRLLDVPKAFVDATPRQRMLYGTRRLLGTVAAAPILIVLLPLLAIVCPLTVLCLWLWRVASYLTCDEADDLEELRRIREAENWTI